MQKYIEIDEKSVLKYKDNIFKIDSINFSISKNYPPYINILCTILEEHKDYYYSKHNYLTKCYCDKCNEYRQYIVDAN